MAGKYANGQFQPRNATKYVGKGTPTYRSSWEHTVMTFFDNNPAILQWASEAIHVNYRNPFTGKNTIYVPDFFILYMDKAGKQHAEIIEVKPLKETSLAEAKSTRDKAAAILNMAKWQACQAYCNAHGLRFRVVTEHDIFNQGRA
jgi:hypothetical protein